MKTFTTLTILIILVLVFANFMILNQDEDQPKTSFYAKSLHATNRGIGFLYSKEQGGLERITGKSAREVGCYQSKCHASSCDDCHQKTTDGGSIYTSDTATLYNACVKCHGDMAKENHDVHFSKGMKCLDCHTPAEIHGDGREHNTFNEPGFFSARCEKCHKDLSKSESHTAHNGKVDCIACHDESQTTCLNCHVETRMAKGKQASVPLRNMTFLVNHDGKVTTANMLSYVYRNNTMITFAKTFNHSIKKAGRKCEECHNSQISKELKNNTLKLVWWNNDSLHNVKGVIPVLEGFDWNLVFLDKENGKWRPLTNPAKPLLNYSGYCSPITRDQLNKLAN